MNSTTTRLMTGLICLSSTTAHARLVSIDSPQFGPGTLTYDTETALSWLDPYLTTGHSYNTMSGLLQSDPVYDGLRHAHEDELTTLFLHAGFPGVDRLSTYLERLADYNECLELHPPDPGNPDAESPCGELPSFGGDMGRSPDNAVYAPAFLELTGATSYQAGNPEVFAMTGSFTPTGSVQLGRVDFVDGNMPGYALSIGQLNYGPQTGANAIGHWLVYEGTLGDLTNDATVDQDDLDIILAHWGDTVAPAALTMGDPSGDGRVGIEDLDLLLANWSITAPAPTLIPEPTTMLLFALLAPLGATCRRRAQR